MGIIDGHGNISGKVGDMVYYYHKGKTYVRKYSKGRDANTPKQQVQRARMRASNRFLSPFKDILRIGYQTAYGKMTAYSEAMQYHLFNAIQQVAQPEGEPPLFEIIIEKAQLSRGYIDTPRIYNCTREGREINLTYDDQLGYEYNRYYDVLMIVAFIPGRKVVTEFNAGTRRSGTGKMILPVEYTEPAHLWALYHNNQKSSRPNKDHISNSVYLGVF